MRLHSAAHGLSPRITPEIAECIFEPFFTTKTVGEGTGIGLHVMHAEKAQALGLDASLMQPLIAHDLLSAIEQIFERRSKQKS